MIKKLNWKYAIGEIIIVIIGISIAFSLNNWNEERKKEVERIKYLESFKMDLDDEINHLRENIETFENKISSIQGLFPFLYGKQAGRDTVVNDVFELANVVIYNPHDVTYNALINSGDLGIFDNFELKRAIEYHYANQVQVKLDYKRQNSIMENYFGDFMIYNLDYGKIRSGDYSFIDDKLLKNIIQSLYGTYGIAIGSSTKEIERCQELRSLLDEELEML
ncbi:DUF6090 family protein [Flexithrix dorotheae]|uniref:DUF6090 family protein n=1 Tax=Flexithrix dorotheae TaxID=70993 RepID=UPI00037BCF5D|nr:DUF6090 family protein [Flexithrix dorotheae]